MDVGLQLCLFFSLCRSNYRLGIRVFDNWDTEFNITIVFWFNIQAVPISRF